MPRPLRRFVIVAFMALAYSAAFGFEWSPERIRPGDHRYLIEIALDEVETARVAFTNILPTRQHAQAPTSKTQVAAS